MSWLVFKILLAEHAPKIFVGLALLTVIALLVIGGWRMRAVVAERDDLRGQLALAEQVNDSLAYQLEAQGRALAARENTVREITEANRNLSEKLREAYAANPETAAWAETCLPDAVECLLK